MKIYIIKTNQEMKIMQVRPELETAFLKEYGHLVIAEGSSIQEVLMKFGGAKAERIRAVNPDFFLSIEKRKSVILTMYKKFFRVMAGRLGRFGRSIKKGMVVIIRLDLWLRG